MAFPRKKTKDKILPIPESHKKAARLGSAGNLSMVMSGAGGLLKIGKNLAKGVAKKLATKKTKMSKMRLKKPKASICPAGIAWAKRTFDKYPSAYANMAASKYCKDPNYAKGSKKK